MKLRSTQLLRLLNSRGVNGIAEAAKRASEQHQHAPPSAGVGEMNGLGSTSFAFTPSVSVSEGVRESLAPAARASARV